MAKPQGNIAARVEAAIKGPLFDAGYSIWDVEYVKEGSERYLRITIDAPQGVGIDDCESAYHIVDPIITDMDPIEESYHLEVSSPGLERDLRTLDHFKASVGEMIRVKLFTALNGKKEYVGKLENVDENGVLTLACPESLTIEPKSISKANIYFDFDSLPEEESGGEE